MRLISAVSGVQIPAPPPKAFTNSLSVISFYRHMPFTHLPRFKNCKSMISICYGEYQAILCPACSIIFGLLDWPRVTNMIRPRKRKTCTLPCDCNATKFVQNLYPLFLILIIPWNNQSCYCHSSFCISFIMPANLPGERPMSATISDSNDKIQYGVPGISAQRV